MRLAAVFIFLIFCGILFSQTERKKAEAVRISSPLKIDGVLDEAVYHNAIPLKGFTQILPYNGEPSYEKSEVFFFYDDNAIYLGAYLYDKSPDSILTYFSERDQFNASDRFGVYFDTQNNFQNAFGFFVSSAGTQMDITANRGEYDREDTSWDAVWYSKVKLTDKGWQVEMKIPYSALRFSVKDDHVWGMNMFRYIARYQSNTSWSRLFVNENGFLHRSGELTGIKKIQPPLRLSITPYVADYVEKRSGKHADNFTKGGLDLKYGLNESFTMDMMVVPDFGQVQSDDQELNLSPFELYYDERRSFFTEGTELFSRANIFYSRRIGSSPKFSDRADDEKMEEENVHFRPTETQMVNATKLSGRTSDGWGIGFLNAMTLPVFAVLKDTLSNSKRNIRIQPFTNYNVAVLEKTLKNNSYISLINTNMSMWDENYSANVTGAEFRWGTKTNSYALSGEGAVSYKPTSDHKYGHKFDLKFAKTKGNFRFKVEREQVSKHFDPRDMGFIRKTNEVDNQVELSYGIYKPFSIFRTWSIFVQSDYKQLESPNVYVASETMMFTSATLKNNHHYGVGAGYEADTHDYYDTRTEGRYFLNDKHMWFHTYLRTDYTKKFVFGAELTRWDYFDERFGFEIEAFAETKIGSKFNIEYGFDSEDERNDCGFVDKRDDASVIYFGKRDIKTIENQLELRYSFNTTLSLSLRGRHYWSGARYNSVHELLEDGTLSEQINYDDNPNVSYNVFNVDARLRWIFRPGSELSLAWKNRIDKESEIVQNNYRHNLNDIFNENQVNSFSIKLLYYLDYNWLRKKG